MSRLDVLQVLKDDLAGPARAFFRAAAAAGPLQLASAPARLDVLGGLGASSGGTVAQMALPARAAVAVQFTSRPTLSIHSRQIAPPIGTSPVHIPLDPLPALATPQAWAAPILALWQVLELTGPAAPHQGAAILIHSNIPISAGQASSSALLAALTAALCSLRGTLDALAPAQLARYVQQAEEQPNPGAGKGGGAANLLDATTCLVADASHPRLFRYSTQPFELVGQIPLPHDLRVLALDTGVRYTSSRETLDELHVAAAMGHKIIETIYRDLGQPHTPLHGYLANTSPLLYRQYLRALLPRRLRGSDFIRTYGPLQSGQAQGLQSLGSATALALDPARIYRVRTAVDHLIAEHEHAEQFLQALEELDEKGVRPLFSPPDREERRLTLHRAGRLLLASHHSYRLRLELSCREADWLVDRLMDAGPDKGIFGGRITGCGGGGTVLAFLDRSPAAADTILEMMHAYHQLTGLTLAISEAGAPGSSGALSPASKPSEFHL